VLANLVPLFVLSLITLPAWWMMWKRSGHSPWISLLMLIPLVNVIPLWVFAFKPWPVDKDRDPFV